MKSKLTTMNMKRSLTTAAVIMAAIFVLAGCKSKSSDSVSAVLLTDSLTYNKVQGDTIKCTIKVDCPSEGNELAAVVRDYISEELRKSVIPESVVDSIKTAAYQGDETSGSAVIDFYGDAIYSYLEGIVKEAENDWQPHLEYMVDIKKSDDTDKYVTYTSTSYCYLGGAHGAATNYSKNISKENPKVVELTVDTTKAAELQPVLKKGVLSYINSNNEEQIAEEKLGEYLFIENGIVPLPKNQPYLTKDGLHFIYAQYEIGPYALGMVEFTVPYEEVEQYMTAEALELIKE